VQAAVKALAKQNGAVPIHSLSEDFGVSHKHLISQFKLMVGVTPKALAKIYRLQHVLHDINPSSLVNWAEVAYAADYYDQAHFNHEFAAFTGLSPGDYLRMRRQISGNTLGQAEDVHFIPLG
jgi:AraC-like DNA-binding protein